MSSCNIVKKNVDKSKIKDNNSKPVKNTNKNLSDFSGYYEPTPEEHFDFFQGSELFNHICDVKYEMENYNRLLLRNCCAGELYEFFKQFIIFLENSLI